MLIGPTNINDYKLLTRIYKHSTPQFKDRVNSFIENNRKRKYDILLKNKNDITKLGDKLVVALYLCVNTDQLINIIFSKVVRFIGLSGGITQNELLVNLSNEMLITLKYILKNNNLILENKFSNEEINIINEVKNILDLEGDLPFESKYNLGNLILELILDEFNYIFGRNKIIENNNTYVYIYIKHEYLNILTGSIFNNIKLPMISVPKEWVYEKNSKNSVLITKIGGYYLDQFNELSRNNNIIIQNSFNKFDSILNEDQINSVNFLNSRAFEINKEMLYYVVNE